MGLICGTFMELSCFEIRKMKAKLEALHIGTLLYRIILHLRIQKGSVCGKVAIMLLSDSIFIL